MTTGDNRRGLEGGDVGGRGDDSDEATHLGKYLRSAVARVLAVQEDGIVEWTEAKMVASKLRQLCYPSRSALEAWLGAGLDESSTAHRLVRQDGDGALAMRVWTWLASPRDDDVEEEVDDEEEEDNGSADMAEETSDGADSDDGGSEQG